MRAPVTVAFPLVDEPETSLLAWTTTPWTLPSNLTLCVHPDFTYIKIHDEKLDKNFILHENLLKTIYKDPKKAKYKKIGQFQGSDMNGWRYVPLFEYFTEEVTSLLNLNSCTDILLVRRQSI
jgi:isoleucyl-tRNA synthetase